MTRADYEETISGIKQEIRRKEIIVAALEEVMEEMFPLPPEPPKVFDVDVEK